MKHLVTILILVIFWQVSYSQKTISWVNLSELYDTSTMTLRSGPHKIIARIGINRKIRYDTISLQIMKDTTEFEVNYLPVADAGNDTTFLYRKTGYLKGRGVDRDGKIVAYQWSRVRGGSCRISYSTRKETTVTSMAKGVYVFRLEVTDDKGGKAWDEVKITVQ